MQFFKNQIETEPVVLSATNKRIILCFILIVALVLRLQHINQPYTDLAGWRQSSMAMMADNFFHRNANILFPEVSWNGPGESYNGREFQTVTYTARLLYSVVGQHDWVGRLVTLLFGVWGVFAFYKLVRRVWGETHGLACAAMLALLPAAIYFDRSFLPDPAMVSLVITGLWMLVAYLQTDRTRYLVSALFFCCLGFLTKITGMLLLLPMLYAVLSILSARKNLTLKHLLKIIGPGLIVIAVVAAYYLWARHLSLHYPPYHFAGAENWVWDEGLSTWLQQNYFLIRFQSIAKNWLWGLPFLLLFLIGFITSFVSVRNKRNASNPEQVHFYAPYLFHFWFLGFVVFYAMGAKELIGNFWNFHISSPVVAAFSGYAVVAVWQRLRNKKLAVAVLVLILCWIALSDRRVLKNTFTDKYYKGDYLLGMRLRHLRQPDDLVIVLAREVGSPIAIFYSGGRGWVFPPAGKGNWDELPATDAACIATLETLRKEGAAWFGIYTDQYEVLKKSYPQFVKHLTTNYTLRAEEPEFVIFRLQPAKP